MGSNVDIKVGANQIVSQVDYMSLLGFDNGDSMDWNYLDADEDVDINLF